MTNKQEINHTITLESGLISEPEYNMYITDEKIILGEHIIDFDSILKIESIDYKPRDWVARGTIIANGFTGLILALVLPIPLFVRLNVFIFSLLLGWSIVKILKDEPYTYIQLETQEETYQFGISTAIETATLYSVISEKQDSELKSEDLLTNTKQNT